MNIQTYMQNIGIEARKASRAMASADTLQKNNALNAIAKAILREKDVLLAANKLDLDAARANGLEPAMLDRLAISEKTIASMAEGLTQIANLADPIGEMTDFKYMPSGIPVSYTHLDVYKRQALQALVSKPIPDTTVVIILPKLEREAKNSAWFSALEQHAVLIANDEVSAANLPKWIANRLAQQGQQASPQTLDFLANQVEGNLLAANQEVQKLGLLYPQGELTDEAVREAVLNVSRFDAFQLGEAVLLGDAARTARILQGLQDEGENPVAVMSPLMWVLRPLVRVKQAEMRGENLQTAMTNARIFGDVFHGCLC